MPYRDSAATVLIVDDSAQNRAVIEGQLAASGYVVIPAETGEQAIVQFKAHVPDLVLLDIFMPGMDGVETCRRMRTLPHGQEVPIVFLTASSDRQTHSTALEAGADDFLMKPIHRTELLMRVRSLLRIKRLHDELRHSVELIKTQNNALIKMQQQKEDLTALVVHDLRSPIAAVVANGYYISQDRDTPEETRSAARDILVATESMQRMVMNMLDVMCSEDASLLAKPAEVDVRRLLDDIVTAMSRRAAERNQSLVACCAIEEAIRVDPELLRRLIENLLDNCFKYAPARSSIQIDAAPVGDDLVEIRVRDEGLGVPAEFREKIFLKHVQLERDAASGLRTGRGLGLAFCRLTAELHGGRIWVEDNQPKGSVFCVQIPRRLP